jgi:hypothetical protein
LFPSETVVRHRATYPGHTERIMRLVECLGDRITSLRIGLIEGTIDSRIDRLPSRARAALGGLLIDLCGTHRLHLRVSTGLLLSQLVDIERHTPRQYVCKRDWIHRITSRQNSSEPDLYAYCIFPGALDFKAGLKIVQPPMMAGTTRTYGVASEGFVIRPEGCDAGMVRVADRNTRSGAKRSTLSGVSVR